MYRILIVIVLCASCFALPPTNVQNKKSKFYKFDGVIGGDQPETSAQFEEQYDNIGKDIYLKAQENIPDPEIIENIPIGKNIQSPIVTDQIKNVVVKKIAKNKHQKSTIDYDDEIFKKQADSARYAFDSSVYDDINDHSIVRKEERDGRKVTGMYSYSDGFFERTVHYVADENGYRVVKEEATKIGDGPQFNPEGRADVQSSLIGSYSIQVDNLNKHPHYTKTRGGN